MQVWNTMMQKKQKTGGDSPDKIVELCDFLLSEKQMELQEN